MKIQKTEKQAICKQKCKVGFSKQYKERIRGTSCLSTKKIEIQNKHQCKIHNICHSGVDYEAYK